MLAGGPGADMHAQMLGLRSEDRRVGVVLHKRAPSSLNKAGPGSWDKAAHTCQHGRCGYQLLNKIDALVMKTCWCYARLFVGPGTLWQGGVVWDLC